MCPGSTLCSPFEEATNNRALPVGEQANFIISVRITCLQLPTVRVPLGSPSGIQHSTCPQLLLFPLSHPYLHSQEMVQPTWRSALATLSFLHFHPIDTTSMSYIPQGQSSLLIFMATTFEKLSTYSPAFVPRPEQLLTTRIMSCFQYLPIDLTIESNFFRPSVLRILAVSYPIPIHSFPIFFLPVNIKIFHVFESTQFSLFSGFFYLAEPSN